MPIITLASRKGGCGKTTVATALAATLAADGIDVALLDADPNGGAHLWATTTHDGSAIAAYAEPDKDRLADLLPALADRHSVLICDTAGFGNQSATICMLAADAVLVPVTPGAGDVVEARKTAAFVEGLARSARRAIPARVLANRIRRATTLSRHTLAQLETLALPRLQTVLSDAVNWGEISFSGALPSAGSTAASELAALVVELRDLGWLPAVSAPIAA
jgi:chromosome partitioning protein